MHQLRLSTQPSPCAVPAAAHHVRNTVGEDVQQTLLASEWGLWRQAGPMAIQAVSFLGHLSPLPTLETSVALLPTPSPRSLDMQNATAPACTGNYKATRLQLLSVVLKAPAFRPAYLSPRLELSWWGTQALNSISWP